jgi:HTH-like domain
LLVRTKAIFNEMKGAYGWSRIWRELLTRSVHAGEERVRKLMKAHRAAIRKMTRFQTSSKRDWPKAICGSFAPMSFCALGDEQEVAGKAIVDVGSR